MKPPILPGGGTPKPVLLDGVRGKPGVSPVPAHEDHEHPVVDFTTTVEAILAAFDHGGLAGLGDDDHTQYHTDARHAALNHSFVDHGNLAGLTDDDHTAYHTDARALTWHSALSGAHVTNGDTHDHLGGDGGTVAHSSLGGVGTDDHHPQVHAHNGADGSGTVAFSSTTGYIPEVSRTISGGTFSVSGLAPITMISVDTESAASTDDLDDMTGGSLGQIVILHSAASTRDVVVKYTAGSLSINGSVDFTLTNIRDTITLIHDGTRWLEIGRGDNS